MLRELHRELGELIDEAENKTFELYKHHLFINNRCAAKFMDLETCELVEDLLLSESYTHQTSDIKIVSIP